MSERMDIQNVISQMRTMKLQSQNAADLVRLDQPDRLQVGEGVGKVGETRSFGELMSSAINSVNDLQKQSGHLSDALERGAENVTLTETMIASQKATIAFQAVSEARNKLVSAYEKIMNMPI